ncbi:2'-5' RNA ligase family protein [Pseudonocardia sp. HH130630-07]|uniref:2'-5' RNA ligase family protein n=1 Tax=Pseudonocardia sp. HH130630-07 TaxID=1690815 RepID=UPI0008150246|nr:2'-5' RNA ligase family protein [Pseudonocardia sp. HH130630-07]ANY08612.1 hypothetical protein AFB00_22725 [Pseudonocardia sp. HH130630-07]
MLRAVAAHRPGAVRDGIPAHLTLLYPFVPADVLTPDTVRRLRDACAATGPVTVGFTRATSTPTMVSVAPEPIAPVAALARRLRDGWPGYPPYGGRFGPDPAPHVTLALDPGPDAAGIVATAGDLLPVRARLDVAALVETTASGWREHVRFDLGPG